MGLDWSHLIVAVIAGGLAALPGLYQTWQARRRTDAETDKTSADGASIITTAALGMVTRWEARVKTLECLVDELNRRVKALEDENEDLWRGASRLEGQVISLGHEPVWTPGRMRVETPPADGQ